VIDFFSYYYETDGILVSELLKSIIIIFFFLIVVRIELFFFFYRILSLNDAAEFRIFNIIIDWKTFRLASCKIVFEYGA
jgi:hypothetical protein